MTDRNVEDHHVDGHNNSLASYPGGEGSGGVQSSWHHLWHESTHGDTQPRYDPVQKQNLDKDLGLTEKQQIAAFNRHTDQQR